METPENPSPSFEAQLARLEEIVALLDRATLPIEQLLELYEEAMRLIQSCRTYLAQAELRIVQIRSSVFPTEEEPADSGAEL